MTIIVSVHTEKRKPKKTELDRQHLTEESIVDIAAMDVVEGRAKPDLPDRPPSRFAL